MAQQLRKVSFALNLLRRMLTCALKAYINMINVETIYWTCGVFNSLNIKFFVSLNVIFLFLDILSYTLRAQVNVSQKLYERLHSRRLFSSLSRFQLSILPSSFQHLSECSSVKIPRWIEAIKATVAGNGYIIGPFSSTSPPINLHYQD
jgi:hypothetical protein